jgi:Protein of unknown function (DUF4058)
MPMHDWTRVDDGIYHDFHSAWIAELRKLLNTGVLPKGYYALSEQQAGEIGPDVLTLHLPESSEPSDQTDEDGGIAVAAAPPRVEFTATTELKSYVAKRRTIVIRHRSGDRVVALIEVVSPGNKKTRAQLEKFVRKVTRALASGIHLMVVDPFPPRRRDPQGIHGAIWAELEDDTYSQPPDRPLTLVSYSAGPVNTAYVQPFAVGDELKEMPLFLSAASYVPVPLEPAYMNAWVGTPEVVRATLSASSR